MRYPLFALLRFVMSGIFVAAFVSSPATALPMLTGSNPVSVPQFNNDNAAYFALSDVTVVDFKNVSGHVHDTTNVSSGFWIDTIDTTSPVTFGDGTRISGASTLINFAPQAVLAPTGARYTWLSGTPGIPATDTLTIEFDALVGDFRILLSDFSDFVNGTTADLALEAFRGGVSVFQGLAFDDSRFGNGQVQAVVFNGLAGGFDSVILTATYDFNPADVGFVDTVLIESVAYQTLRSVPEAPTIALVLLGVVVIVGRATRRRGRNSA